MWKQRTPKSITSLKKRETMSDAVILKYAGTMAPTAPMAPILLVVGGARPVPCHKIEGTIQAPWCHCLLAEI